MVSRGRAARSVQVTRSRSKLTLTLLLSNPNCPSRRRMSSSLLLSLPPTFATSNAPPTLSIAQIHRALPFFLSPTNATTDSGQARGNGPPTATQTPTYSQLDEECILASLVDQGYIKGYTFHSKGLVVFQKGDRMGFAPVSAVY